MNQKGLLTLCQFEIPFLICILRLHKVVISTGIFPQVAIHGYCCFAYDAGSKYGYVLFPDLISDLILKPFLIGQTFKSDKRD